VGMGRFRTSSGPLLGPLRHMLLARAPRGRRRGTAWWKPVVSVLLGLAAAAGIALYWYFVFGVSDPPQLSAGQRPPPPDAVRIVPGPAPAAE
jgi:hypothetical protein